MKELKPRITGDTTISEAIEILKEQADLIANSEEAAKFHRDDPSWSTLFRNTYKPYQYAVEQYEEALKLNEWLNGKDSDNGHITLKEAFIRMSDQARLSLFHQRINSDIPSIFDMYLKAWWMNRY